MENRYQYTRYNEGATLEYIRKFILEHNPFLKDYVYENNPESLYFYQKDTQSNNFLSIGYVVKYTGVIYRGGFNCNTSIRIVEDLLNALIAKHIHPVGDFSINFSTTIDFNKYTVYDFEMIWDSFKQFDNYDLSTNKEILDKLCEHYSNVIKQYFIPFWKKYSNIQYINDEIIDKVDQMDLADYFGIGLVQFKKLIIMRICKNQRYDSYKEWLLNIYRAKEDEMKNDSEWNAKYNLFKELIEILETQY